MLTANDMTQTGTLTVTGISNVTGGTATLANGKLLIKLTGATGGFDYTVSNGAGGTATA